MPLCDSCNKAHAALKRPKTGAAICRECFFYHFELEVHHTIISHQLFHRGERVCIAASGGKDSTVLAFVLHALNQRYDYGVDFFLLSIDEGISGYRDDSLESVKRNHHQLNIPLTIVSYRDLYGWTMDEIVAQIGLKSNCTFCGVFRRQALDRGAWKLKADKIATGHNADDMAETVLMNLLRGDNGRLDRSVSAITGDTKSLPRCKPFKYCYEKEIVMYAHYKQLDYHSTECIYSPFAYRGYAREYLKDLERVKPSAIIDIIRSAEYWKVKKEEKRAYKNAIKQEKSLSFQQSSTSSTPSLSSTINPSDSSISVIHKPKLKTVGNCERCGYMSSQKICKACLLLEGLNKTRQEKLRAAAGTGAATVVEEEKGGETKEKKIESSSTPSSSSSSIEKNESKAPPRKGAHGRIIRRAHLLIGADGKVVENDEELLKREAQQGGKKDMEGKSVSEPFSIAEKMHSTNW